MWAYSHYALKYGMNCMWAVQPVRIEMRDELHVGGTAGTY